MATESGWLVHLATSEERANPIGNADPAFAGEEPITFRPPDEGVPQEPSDAIPVDNSGLEEPVSSEEDLALHAPAQTRFATVHGAAALASAHPADRPARTLELSFHLAVKARVRLLAKRRRTGRGEHRDA